MTVRSFMVFAIICVSTIDLASAGQLQLVETEVLPVPLGASSGLLSIDPADLKTEPKGKGCWQFSFADQNEVLARISLRIDDPPEGWSPYSIDIDLPFYSEGLVKVEFPVALVNDKNNDTGIDRFLARAQVLYSSKIDSDYAAVNQSAKRLFSARIMNSSEPPDPIVKKNDIRIAYWLVVTTNYLILNEFASVDNISKAARDFLVLNGGLGTPGDGSPKPTRLFDNDTATIPDVRKAVETLDSRNAIVYNIVLRELDKRINKVTNPDFIGSCPKALTLDLQYAEMGKQDLDRFTGNFANPIIASGLAARCHDATIESDLQNHSNIPKTELDAAQVTLERLNLVSSDSSVSNPNFAKDLTTARLNESALAKTLAEATSAPSVTKNIRVGDH